MLSGYVIAGWARGEKDDDGNVTFQTNASGEVDYWDFDNDVVRDESFTLYAVWIRRYSVVIYSPDGEVAATYYLPNNNDTSAEITENNLTNVLPELDKEAKHTYLDEFYYSEDMTEDSRVTFPFTYEKGEERELSVYASWVEGNFKIVRTADDVNTALRNGRGLYLLNDVDCEAEKSIFCPLTVRRSTETAMRSITSGSAAARGADYPSISGSSSGSRTTHIFTISPSATLP